MPAASVSSSISAPIKFIQADSFKIAYKVIGTGQAIILLARFRGTLNDWDPAFVDAVAKSYRVILFDASGAGRSSGIVPTSVTKIVAKLVLLATGPSGNPDFVPANPEFGTRARKPVYDFDDYQFLFFYKSDTAKAACASYLKRLELIEDKDIAATPESYQNMSVAMGDFKVNKERNYFEALKEIKKPVLIANGKFDPSYPLMNSYVLEREIPNSKMIAYPDAGHVFLFQCWREFVPELLAFLAPD
jgi:pimeloyl-ACP methyl ester carboxylesterase